MSDDENNNRSVIVAKITKLFFFCAVFLALCLTCSSCINFQDRKRDFADIFTATLGNGYGGNVRVGPLHAGLLGNIDREGLHSGIWYSNWGEFSIPWNMCSHSLELDLTFLHTNGPGSAWGGLPHYRGKKYEAGGFIPFCSWIRDHGWTPSYMVWHYYTDIEFAVGLYYSLRLGFNFGECADFFLGFVGVDIFNDDLNDTDDRPYYVNPNGKSGWRVKTFMGDYFKEGKEYSKPLCSIFSRKYGPQVKFYDLSPFGTLYLKSVKPGDTNKIFTIPAGFHVCEYDYDSNELIPVDIEITPEEFDTFMKADFPEHNIEQLKKFMMK